MMERKPDQYWLKKIQLFMTLHGVWNRASTPMDKDLDELLCAKCPHNDTPDYGNCELLQKGRKRWEFSKARNILKYNNNNNKVVEDDFICAEWVRHI